MEIFFRRSVLFLYVDRQLLPVQILSMIHLRIKQVDAEKKNTTNRWRNYSTFSNEMFTVRGTKRSKVLLRCVRNFLWWRNKVPSIATVTDGWFKRLISTAIARMTTRAISTLGSNLNYFWWINRKISRLNVNYLFFLSHALCWINESDWWCVTFLMRSWISRLDSNSTSIQWETNICLPHSNLPAAANFAARSETVLQTSRMI